MIFSFILSASLILASLGPSETDDAARFEQCETRTGDAATIDACTSLIESRRLAGEDLAWVYVYRARNYGRAGQSDRALADYNMALQIMPHMVGAQLDRGMFFAALHRPQEVFDDLQPLSDLPTPQAAARLAFLGLAFDDLGKHKQALDGFDAALALYPDDGFRLLKAYSQYRYGEYAAALEGADDLVKRAPAKATYLTLRGVVFRRIGRVTESFRDLDAAVALSPDDAVALNSRCWARAALKREFDLALKDCNAALKAKPNEPGVHDTLGFVYLRMERYQEAIAEYNRALALDPRHASSLFGRGIVRLRLHQEDAGEHDIAAARAIDPRVAQNYADDGVMP